MPKPNVCVGGAPNPPVRGKGCGEFLVDAVVLSYSNKCCSAILQLFITVMFRVHLRSGSISGSPRRSGVSSMCPGNLFSRRRSEV